MSDQSVAQIRDQLLKSQWPQCNALAERLVAIGTQEAQEALAEALTAKTHHVRTGAIRALVALHAVKVIPLIETLLNDRSYETRMEAKTAILTLTGKEVRTGRGE